MEKFNPLCVYVGAKMRKKRKSIPLSQEQVSRAVKIDTSNYAAIERGERNLSIHMLARIALGLKYEVSELMPNLTEIKQLLSK